MQSLEEEIESCYTLVIHNMDHLVTPELFLSYLKTTNVRYPISKV